MIAQPEKCLDFLSREKNNGIVSKIKKRGDFNEKQNAHMGIAGCVGRVDHFRLQLYVFQNGAGGRTADGAASARPLQ